MATCNCKTEGNKHDPEKYRECFLLIHALVLCLVHLAESVQEGNKQVASVLVDSSDLLTSRIAGIMDQLGIDHGY